MSFAASDPEKGREAQELAARVRQALEEEILQMVRLLVDKPTKDLFGQTEFDLRDLLHKVGAKIYEVHLAQKKTAMSAPVSSARTVSKPPTSRTTAPKSL